MSAKPSPRSDIHLGDIVTLSEGDGTLMVVEGFDDTRRILKCGWRATSSQDRLGGRMRRGMVLASRVLLLWSRRRKGGGEG